jgi:hypothetical protein
MSEGVKSEPTCTARKIAANKSQVAMAEGPGCGRSSVVVRYVVAEDGICIKDTSEAEGRD